MKTSIALRMPNSYVGKDGTVALYLYVRLNKENDFVPLDIRWPHNLIDTDNNCLLPRTKSDKECNDLNMLIRKKIGMFNDIFVEYRLSERPLTLKMAIDEFRQFELRKSFTSYFEKKIKERLRRKKIKLSTAKSHEVTLEWLKLYRPEVKFSDLDKKFVEGFEAWLGRQNNRRSAQKVILSANSVANQMKCLKAYVSLAVKDEIPLVNPFEVSDVRTAHEQGAVRFLNPKEVAKLIDYYENGNMPIGERVALCRYLIACTTSLRISDILKLDKASIEQYRREKRMVFMPVKQRKDRPRKKVSIPLHQGTLRYMRDLVEMQVECERKLVKIDEAYARKALGKISEKLGMPNLKGFHSGRHTFATSYLRAGGQLHKLQVIMGHSDIRTTMLYVHLVDEDLQDELIELSAYYASFM